MARSGQTNEDTSSGRKPSRGFLIGVTGVALFAAVLTGAGVIAAERDAAPAADYTPDGPAPTVAVIRAPHQTTPPEGFALQVDTPQGDVPAPAVQQTATPTPQLAPTASSIAETPSETPQPTVTPVASSASVTPTVDGPWSATPTFNTPVPAPTLSPDAAALATDIEAQFGARIVAGGQDWGDEEDAQLRNLGAVSTALESLPDSLLAAANDNAGGALAFLSNGNGRTEDGWQPYGDRAANFYTNEDKGPGGARAANEVVLQPGSSAQTIAHEIMHAYQMRGLAAGGYVSALLTPEMKSFMEATGWRQLVSDDDVRAAGGSWEAINGYFSYEGRVLDYVNQYGNHVTLYTPNPLEAFAEAGGLYYARAPGTALPDWPEYWGWFDANAG